ncbi:MAG: bacterial Ig-like domain-containing protein [Lachnospirales bacterium]
MKRKLLCLALAMAMTFGSFGGFSVFADENTTETATEAPAEISVTDVVVDYKPLKVNYAKDDLFRTEGLEVSAKYSDGTEKTLKSSEYTISIEGKEYADGDRLKGTGRKNVDITTKKAKGVTNTKKTSFPIEISTSAMESVSVVTMPEKTTYYLNDEFDDKGMEVGYSFNTKQGKAISGILKKNEYRVSGFESGTTGEKVVTVSSVANPQAKTTINVTVKERQVTGIVLSKYPRTTYKVGEEFDGSDMKVAIGYDNGDLEDCEYSVDTSVFDSSVAGTTMVKIVVSGYKDLELPITIVEEMDNKWRTSIFGQTSNHDDTSKASVTADEYGTVNGKINVKAWEGSGKVTNDHDGMTYYYTALDANSNFKLCADVTVNKYLEHDNDDTKRNGQEAFGIMVRDAVPFKDSQGNIIINQADAVKDSDGTPTPVLDGKLFASNMALFGGYSGRGWPDESRANYEAETKLNRINLLVREGVTEIDGGGSRVGPFACSSDFPKEGNKYQLTMERFNGGLYVKCYNYQTEETMDKYYYDDSFLFTQNSDNYYVGFFGARWADIDVENVSFYETNKATDQSLQSDEGTAITPKISWRDKTYSTSLDYNFGVNVGATNGRITIKMNDNVVVNDAYIKGTDPFSARLNPNSVNKLYIYYTPSETLNLSSYKPIVVKKDIVHRDESSLSTIYASPDGSLKGTGSYDKPYDIDTAIGILKPGQTLVLKEGTYIRKTPIEIVLGDDGRADAYKIVKAEEGKKVVIDGNKESAIISHTGSYWKFEGIEFANSGDNLKAFHLGGSYNILENCVFHDNGDLGLQISRVSGQQKPEQYPAYNLVKNCESYNNCDPSMINADGFGAKLTVGEGNKFVDCKSHHNVDDGWDLYTKVNSGAIGVVTLENCQAYKNGYKLNEDGSETLYGAGGNNGFKMGGENVAVQHILINCSAYGNASNGVTTNSNPALKLVDVKSYNNGASNIVLFSDKPEEFNYDITGLITFGGGKADIIGSVNFEADFENAAENPLISESNYWTGEDGKSVNSKGEEATMDMINK